MTAGENISAEPSMDEILASIRQIIAADPKGGYQPPVVGSQERQEHDIMELTHPLPEDARMPHPSQRNGVATSENDISPLSKCVLDGVANGVAAPVPQPQQAFGFGIGTDATKPTNPVEELVRQLLQPLLKEWVDVHLPALVRWTINEQVERIIRQGVGQAVPTYDSSRLEKNGK